MSQAMYDTLSVTIKAGEYTFKANGQNLKFKGFMVLYVEGQDNEKEEENTKIPDLKEKQEVKKQKLEPKQSFTEPPPRYTEASLVKALEEKGIGRPSTYAPTISTIIFTNNNNYSRKKIYRKSTKTIISNRTWKNSK